MMIEGRCLLFLMGSSLAYYSEFMCLRARHYVPLNGRFIIQLPDFVQRKLK